MNADDFARRCIRRLTGSFEDQWIPPLPDYLVEYCQEAEIEATPTALLSHLQTAYGVMVKPDVGSNESRQWGGCSITIPEGEAADILFDLFCRVPLTLQPPTIIIRDTQGNHRPTRLPDGSNNPRPGVALVHHYPEGYPWQTEVARRWVAAGKRSEAQDW